MSNNTCPNCGAAMITEICDYCGTRMIDMTALDINSREPFWLRFHNNGRITKIKVRLSTMNMRVEHDYCDYTDAFMNTYVMSRGVNRTINMELYGVPGEDIIEEGE